MAAFVFSDSFLHVRLGYEPSPKGSPESSTNNFRVPSLFEGLFGPILDFEKKNLGRRSEEQEVDQEHDGGRQTEERGVSD